MENGGCIKQILEDRKKGFFILPFCGFNVVAHLSFFILHSFPGRREGFRRDSDKSGVLICK